MSRIYTVLRLGPGVTAAQRQASLILALGVGLAVVAIGYRPDLTADLLIFALVSAGFAVLGWFLPWRRWPSQATLLLALPILGLLAWAMIMFGPVQLGLGSLFVLIFVWAGLHHRPSGVVALIPVAVAAFVLPLLVTGQSASQVVLRTLLVVPVMVLVGYVIADRVDRLEQTKTRLANAEQWRSSLMLTLAHDVRAPLTAIQTTLEMLNEDSTRWAADRHRLIALGLRQTARIRRLATELIEVERIEAGQITLNRQELPVRPAIDDALEHGSVPQAQVRVEPPDLRVPADPVRFDQVLVNLVGNAARHGEPPIEVRASRANGSIQITVRDHGAGLPEAGGKRLFQRFGIPEQGPDSVGLGLWVARQLVLAHGGQIRYEPAHPGARFVITLPSAAGPVS